MLGLSQQLALLQTIGRVSEYLRSGVEKSQISPLLDAMYECKLAQSRSPRSASATFLDAIALFIAFWRLSVQGRWLSHSYLHQ